MRILGISGFSPDAAVALVQDGRIVAAVQEERFSRRKFDLGFPAAALRHVLAEAGCALAEIDRAAFFRAPAPPALRTALLAFDPGFDALRLTAVDHHLAHAASGFFPSPFATAAILSLDGADDATATSLALGNGNTLGIETRVASPHSLGLLYSAFAAYLGFKPNSGEYKMMGLAPYGTPRFAARIRDEIVEIAADGGIRLAVAAPDADAARRSLQHRLATVFGQPSRVSDDAPPTGFHADVAASIQAVVNAVVVALARDARRRTGARNLCLAGDVALNSVANGEVVREGIFDAVWIQPAAGNAGAALGAALADYHLGHGGARSVSAGRDGMRGGCLGPGFADADVAARLAACGARFRALPEAELIAAAADALAAGHCVAWMQGRMEFGPRALGARSILCDPRLPDARRRLNREVKFREDFRPFAPSVLAEDAASWFELDGDSPYMLLVVPVRDRDAIPAVAHVDGSARVQTVDAGIQPRFHTLLTAFKARTGCGVLVNTSFNVRGEPIVCSPEDAFRCFMGSDIDVLVAGNCILEKAGQTVAAAPGHRASFAPD
jgi:carbamoyltransferase